jgi:FkbM family methyltransferase
VKQLLRRSVPKSLWAWLRVAHLMSFALTYRKRRVRHYYGGIPLTVYLSDPLAEGWYDHDWNELPELNLLQLGSLRRGARVFDIGAHQGVVAMMLSNIVGPEGEVIAVEANPHNARVAKRNAQENGISQMRVIHAAVGDRSGVISFNKGLNGRVDDESGEWGRRSVATTTVDEIASQYGRPDVLFIDVEGYECRVLRGASSTLDSHPDCFVEVHPGHGLEVFGGTVTELTTLIPEHAYRRFVGTEGGKFRALRDQTELPPERFFLVALGRRCE